MDFALANTGQKSSGNGPIYVYDSDGMKAAVAVQLFRARRSLIKKETATSVTAKAIAELEHHGISPAADEIKAIAREAKESYDATTMKLSMPTVAAKTAKDSIGAYHWLKYLYNIGPVGVFDAGQIQVPHVKALQNANIKVIINMRQGQEIGGKWAAAPQEPINLLNLGFGGPTKGISGVGAKTFNSTKHNLIIDPSRPPSWVCSFPATISYTTYKACVDNTLWNFESQNVLEWGDAVGQHTRNEGLEIEKAGIKYYHLPVGGLMAPPVPFNPATFLKYSKQFIDAINVAQAAGGHVLFHCTIGYRTGAFPTALLGLITETATKPMLTRVEMNRLMHGWGYDVADEKTGHVFEKGTNSLFGGLNTLKFSGTVDWQTGKLTGKVITRSGPTPAPTTPAVAPASSSGSSAVASMALALVLTACTW
jgi:protein tyrosine phosphatase (PTP) superfamily phosphohydrolase (DUF442 family)